MGRLIFLLKILKVFINFCLPIRGPKFFQEGSFIYKNKTEGNLENFFGEEEILKKGKQIYKTNYSGGLVDQRRE